eukprot:TRINITY_DN67457_c13_g1_i1.p1 TRINITY_DN67457_c13_g1~~TRINITY_DN67457_c13_g1_i1.p1  ORF type:complete len:244 (-),score=5.83 TRINITY_DN67457_c13_g1_i1:448-1155(-)
MARSVRAFAAVLGPPAAGKTTVCSTLCSKLMPTTYHLNVGGLLREYLEAGSVDSTWHTVKDCLNAGKVVPIEITLNVVANRLEQAEMASNTSTQLILFDGFPRTTEQLQALQQHFGNPIATVWLNASLASTTQRLRQRAREDDLDDAVIKNRFDVWEDMYQALERDPALLPAPLVSIDANRSEGEVARELHKKLQECLGLSQTPPSRNVREPKPATSRFPLGPLPTQRHMEAIIA